MRAVKVATYLMILLSFFLVLSTAHATTSPLEETISHRLSTRNYTNENIASQQLLEVLWSSYGYFNARRNVPQIGNDYSLTIFAVNGTGSYRYIPENNSLIVHDLSVNKEIIRPHDQGWPSNASVVLIIVWNQTKMNNGYLASAEAGCVVQNVYLASVSLGLGTCCVGGISSQGLRSDLKLPSTMIPLVVMPLGYPAEPYPQASPNYEFMAGNLPPVQYGELSFEDSIRNMLFTQIWPAENLSLQKLSQLLWAAYGYTNVTHDTSYHRTTPSAYGIYPLVIYVSNATGIYQYLPENHSTAEILLGDRRSDVANACSNQSWAAKAPTIFIIGYNASYNNGNTGDGGAVSHEFIEVDAGAVIQQLFLEASAWNLSANIVADGLEDWNGTGAEELRSILNLPPSLIPLYIVPVGSRIIDSTAPTINTPSQDPEPTSVEPYQNVTITVSVVDEETGVREVILSYTIDEGITWTNTTMNNITAYTYIGKIPGFEAGTYVKYKIIAYDYADNIAIEDKNGEYYVYTVVSEFYDSILLILMMVTLIAVIMIKIKKHFSFKHLKSNLKQTTS